MYDSLEPVLLFILLFLLILVERHFPLIFFSKDIQILWDMHLLLIFVYRFLVPTSLVQNVPVCKKD